MKRLFKQTLLMAAMASAVTFVSCNEDDEGMESTPPVLEATILVEGQASTSASIGDTISYALEGTAEAGVNRLVGKLTVDGTSSTLLDLSSTGLELDGEGTLASYADFKIVTPDYAGKTLEFTFVLVDNLDARDTTTFSIMVDEISVSTYETVLLGAQGNSNEGFYNAIENIRYTYAQARDASGVSSSTVDFAYYWGNTNKSTIAAIDDAGLNSVYSAVSLPIDGIFGTKNATRFAATTMTVAEFDGILTSSALESAASFDAGASSATELEVGDVVAFALAEARGAEAGLLKIVSVDDTNGNGTITIEVKISADAE